MWFDTSRGAAVRDLIANALKRPLMPAQYEGILSDIWKENITDSGVAYKSLKQGRSTEYVSGAEDLEPIENKLSVLSDGTVEKVGRDDAYQFDENGILRSYGSHMNMVNGREVDGILCPSLMASQLSCSASSVKITRA